MEVNLGNVEFAVRGHVRDGTEQEGVSCHEVKGRGLI